MLIDTHCHLDISAFDADRETVWQAAIAQQVRALVIPAVTLASAQPILDWCATHPNCGFALGIHPMYVDTAPSDAVAQLTTQIETVLASPLAPQLVAIGEIGLDFYLTRANEAKQLALFEAQLTLAQQFSLPVLLHVRGAIDTVLKYCRKHRVVGGIAHAFNGSVQQAQHFAQLGFKLGVGGACTYPRALKIRAMVEQLPLTDIVLETDAPDIPPTWLGHRGRNTPDQLKKIAEEIAAIRRMPSAQIIEITGKNSFAVLPKLVHLCT